MNAEQNLRCSLFHLKNTKKCYRLWIRHDFNLGWKMNFDVPVDPLTALYVEAGVGQLGEAGLILKVVLGHEAVGSRHQPGGAHQGRGALYRGARLEVKHSHEGDTETEFITTRTLHSFFTLRVLFPLLR